MQDDYDRSSVLLVQLCCEFHDFRLMTEIEKCDGFIDELEPRLLPKSYCKSCLLPLSARQSLQRALAEKIEPVRFNRLLNDLTVSSSKAIQPRHVWVAAVADEFAHGQLLGRHGGLR